MTSHTIYTSALVTAHRTEITTEHPTTWLWLFLIKLLKKSS